MDIGPHRLRRLFLPAGGGFAAFLQLPHSGRYPARGECSPGLDGAFVAPHADRSLGETVCEQMAASDFMGSRRLLTPHGKPCIS